MKILIDAMGGDNSPDEIIKGCVETIDELESEIILIGNEKIINEKVDIDKLLVVTFTNAAAAEMRERVLKAIYEKIDKNPEDERLQKQVTLLNKASICTIDSFCLDVVRNNFFEIDISQNFRIGDTTETEILKQEVIEDLFEEKYENEDKDFEKLINTYTSYKDDTPLKELILKIYTYIQSNPFPEKWLKEKILILTLKILILMI